MPLEAFSIKDHGHLRLTRGTYFFLQNRPLVQISLAEAVRVALDLPIAFVRGEQGLALAALLSLEGASNPHVGPKGGWLGAYLPALVCAHPFSQHFQDGKSVLMIDTDSDWLSSTEGQALLDEEGKPTEILKGIIDLLTNKAPVPGTAAILKALDDLKLLVHWENLPENILCIDKQALDNLEPEVFAGLRTGNLLALVYAHLFSTNRMERLRHLKARKESLAEQVEKQAPGLGIDIDQDEDIITFR